MLRERRRRPGGKDLRRDSLVESVDKHGQTDTDSQEPEEHLAGPTGLVQDAIEHFHLGHARRALRSGLGHGGVFFLDIAIVVSMRRVQLQRVCRLDGQVIRCLRVWTSHGEPLDLQMQFKEDRRVETVLRQLTLYTRSRASACFLETAPTFSPFSPSAIRLPPSQLEDFFQHQHPSADMNRRTDNWR